MNNYIKSFGIGPVFSKEDFPGDPIKAYVLMSL
jgi:hypothetical protein